MLKRIVFFIVLLVLTGCDGVTEVTRSRVFDCNGDVFVSYGSGRLSGDHHLARYDIKSASLIPIEADKSYFSISCHGGYVYAMDSNRGVFEIALGESVVSKRRVDSDVDGYVAGQNASGPFLAVTKGRRLTLIKGGAQETFLLPDKKREFWPILKHVPYSGGSLLLVSSADFSLCIFDTEKKLILYCSEPRHSQGEFGVLRAAIISDCVIYGFGNQLQYFNLTQGICGNLSQPRKAYINGLGANGDQLYISTDNRVYKYAGNKWEGIWKDRSLMPKHYLGDIVSVGDQLFIALNVTRDNSIVLRVNSNGEGEFLGVNRS